VCQQILEAKTQVMLLTVEISTSWIEEKIYAMLSCGRILKPSPELPQIISCTGLEKTADKTCFQTPHPFGLSGNFWMRMTACTPHRSAANTGVDFLPVSYSLKKELFASRCR